MHCLLAVDAGGTKAEALLVTLAGQVLGRGLCRPDDPAARSSWGGKGRSPESVLTAVRRALGEHHPASLHVSGMGRWDVPELMARVSPADVEAVPVAEWQAPLALADVTYGVVVLAGTGAFVHGSRADGRESHLDGLGPYLGDYGSGYMIGLQALRAVCRADWHPRHHTALVQVVAEVLGIDVAARGVGPLVGYVHEPRDRADLASLARHVDAAAEAGDAVAQGILASAADSQAEVVLDLVERLGLHDREYVMVAAGSVATHSRRYWARLCEQVATAAPNLRPVVPAWPQVVGTALWALRQAQDRPSRRVTVEPFRAVRERLLATLPGVERVGG